MPALDTLVLQMRCCHCCLSVCNTGHGDVEVPWWTYGARGMQLWFPSSLAEPLSPTTRDSMTAHSTDPELEFDREVYPIGISIAEVAIIGQSPCPHLLRTSLQADVAQNIANLLTNAFGKP